MARRSVIFEDWGFGDFGRMEPWKAPRNSWTGSNMVVYRTGEIGCRAGLRLITPSSALTAGIVWGVGHNLGNSRRFWYGQGNQIKTLSIISNTLPLTLGGTLTGTPGQFEVDKFEGGDVTYILTRANGAYTIDTGTVAAMTGSPSGRAISLHGDRMLIGTASGGVAVIRYSDAANFNSWPAANSIVVGGSDLITAMLEQRGATQILKNNAGFYSLTGVPGINETLRFQLRNLGPSSNSAPGKASLRGNDLIAYVAGEENIPTLYNGVKPVQVDHIITANTGAVTLSVEGFKTGDPNGMLIVQGAVPSEGTAQLAWLYNKGAWSKHTFGVTTIGLQTYQSTTYLQDGLTIGTARTGPVQVLTDGGSASAAPNFYTWLPDIDRPGTENNPFAISAERAGDNSSAQVSGNFSSPVWFSDEGNEIVVRGVIVDFRKWNTGGSSSNHFDVSVEAVRPYGDGANISNVESWDESGGQASTVGTVDRVHMSFGAQGEGEGFRFHFTNCRGVAIRRVQVIIESSSARI